MPMYEFKCSRCGQEKEVRAKMSEYDSLEPPKCSECLIPMAKKVSTGTMFDLKGDGWTPKSKEYYTK